MINKKPTLSCFSNILDDLDILKDSGILTNERIDEIKSWVAPESFIDVELKDGGTVNGYKLHKFTKKMWQAAALSDSWSYIVRNDILNELLSFDEIEKINDRANNIWRLKEDARRFEKATKIAAADYDGWVYLEGAGYNEGYFESSDELLDGFYEARSNLAEAEMDSDEISIPKFCWATTSKPCCQIDLYNILENAELEAYENYNGPVGVKELQNAIDVFNKLNEDDVSYTPCYKTAIIL